MNFTASGLFKMGFLVGMGYMAARMAFSIFALTITALLGVGVDEDGTE